MLTSPVASAVRRGRGPRTWRPLDKERQRGLGGSLFDARQSPSHELSVPVRS
jgi:hypothetical protein